MKDGGALGVLVRTSNGATLQELLEDLQVVAPRRGVHCPVHHLPSEHVSPMTGSSRSISQFPSPVGKEAQQPWIAAALTGTRGRGNLGGAGPHGGQRREEK